jgi:hypothetical protein
MQCSKKIASRMSVLGRVPYREQLQRGYFKQRQTGNRRATRTETAAPAIKARALRLRHDNSAANERRI